MVFLKLATSWNRPDVALACLVMLALLVGPVCAPMCAGQACLPSAANASKDVQCHGMASQGGDLLLGAAGGHKCGLGDASFAVLSKPSFSVAALSDRVDGTHTPGAISALANVLAKEPHHIFSADGPPLRSRSEILTIAVLRV